MKKLLLMLLGVFMTLPMHALDFTYEYEGQTLNYSITGNDEVSVSPVDDKLSGALVIPKKVTNEGKDFTVTSIEDKAFDGCSGLTSVTIPESVTKVGEGAFNGCFGLTKAEFASIESLCEISFLDRGNPLRWAHNLWIAGKEIHELNIPESVTSIGSLAFEGCRGLTSVTIPESVTSIGYGAFDGCSGLTSVTIPASVSKIREATFHGCSGLTSVTIPESVTSFGTGAFELCSGLTSITIPESVTSIGYAAFHGCYGLTSVFIPNSVTIIGGYAFSGCSGLKSVIIPASVTAIGGVAFHGCTELTSVYYNTEEPVEGDVNIFDKEQYEAATLFIPEAGLEKCKAINPWMNFMNLQAHDFSGIEAVEADSNAPCEIFRLNGIFAGSSIEGLAPGIYIVRQGNLMKKIAVK